MDEAAAAPENGSRRRIDPQIRPARRVEVEFAVAVADREIVAGKVRAADMGGRRERAPVELGRDRGDHDPGVDAVGADEQGDAVPRLLPARIGRHETADQRREQVGKWDREQRRQRNQAGTDELAGAECGHAAACVTLATAVNIPIRSA
jgi:hypothetical protein